MSETVIKVENLYKEYKLGVISHGTLYRDMQSWWAKVRGKEDPNSLISSSHGQEAEKDSFLALNDVNFEIKEGDRVGIIGKNGAGKSTLLKILSQITSPTRGTITIHGKVGSLLEVGTGFHTELTGRENIYLNGSILGMNRHEISDKLDEIVDFAGIEKHLDTPVKRYSSGMMVRLGFAVAAHLDTDILIADEVLAVGDAEFQKKALDKMGDLSTGEGRTVLFVSHNMGAVKKLCNSGIVLGKGKIDFDGSIDDCIMEYTGLSNKSEENQCYWENDGSIKDQVFTPLKMYLTDASNQPLDKIFNMSNIYVVIESEIFEIDSSFNMGVELLSNTGETIFLSRLGDYNTPKISKGKNMFYIKLPINDLNAGNYQIKLGAWLYHVRYIIQPESQPTIFFSVNDVFITEFGDDKRPGFFAPKIEWKIIN